MRTLTLSFILLITLVVPLALSLVTDEEAATGVPDFIQTKLAAEQGVANSQLNLGLMYYTGDGVSQDYQEAMVWYRRAAEQGYAQAQTNLGVMYDNGEGVSQDAQQAAVWYRRAAEQGEADAQYNLGLMYYNGQGVPENRVMAYALFNLAAARGSDGAQNTKSEMAQHLTASQIDEAEDLSTRWYQGEPLPEVR